MQVHNVHISRAVIRGQSSGSSALARADASSSQIKDFRLSSQPQKFETKGLLLVITTAPACHPGPRQSSRSVALAKRITALRTRMVGKAFMRKRTPRNHETIMSRLLNSKVWSFSSVFKSFQRHQNMLRPTTTSR